MDQQEMLNAGSSEFELYFCEFRYAFDRVDSIYERADLSQNQSVRIPKKVEIELIDSWLRHACSGTSREGSAVAHLVQRNVPTPIRHLNQPRYAQRYIPILHLPRIGIIRIQNQIEMRVLERDRGLGVGGDVEVNLFDQIRHRECCWRGREEGGRFL